MNSITKIRTIIIDDEQSWIDNISSLVNYHSALELVATFDNPEAAKLAIEQNPDFCELIILDINMPKLNGIDFAHLINIESIAIVLCSSSPEFGPQAFDIGAVDYIQKPVTIPKLMKAVERVIKKKESEIKTLNFSVIDVPINFKNFFFVRSNHSYVRIDYKNLLYIKSLQNYTQFFITNNTTPHTVLVPFQTCLDQLDSVLIKQIFRGIAVNINHLITINNSSVEMSNGIVLTTSPNYAAEIELIINQRLIVR